MRKKTAFDEKRKNKRREEEWRRTHEKIFDGGSSGV
jgi:hypothetical protein